MTGLKQVPRPSPSDGVGPDPLYGLKACQLLLLSAVITGWTWKLTDSDDYTLCDTWSAKGSVPIYPPDHADAYLPD
eukprot:241803-Heterocapsa_arctica.AAC.1